jgi:hypothetical protein
MKVTIFALCLLAFLFVFSTQTFAVDFTVNLGREYDFHDSNIADGICESFSGYCSIRAAVEQANALASNDRIFFMPGIPLPILLTAANGGQIPITNNGTLQIIGAGANDTTINCASGPGPVTPIFNANNATVTISGVTLTGCTSAMAIYSNGGSLTLDSVAVTNNTSFGNGGGASFVNSTGIIINSNFSGNTASTGGAVHSVGSTLFVSGSTFSGNYAFPGGGGLSGYCGGISSSSALTIVNSTITGNNAFSGNGGGICNFLDLTLRNATITNNEGNFGAGIANFGTLNLGNTIVAGNAVMFASSFPEIFTQGSSTVTSAGGNLIGDSTGDSTTTGNPISYQPTDIRDVNPLLGALQNNGGTTPTRALLAGSPAIDKGLNALTSVMFDQRGTGFLRILDGDGNATAIVDIGAFEARLLAPTAAAVSLSGRVLAGNRYVSNALVQLIRSNGEIQTARTNSFGYYRFIDVPAGAAYLCSATSKSYQFDPQIINLLEDFDGLDFTAR